MFSWWHFCAEISYLLMHDNTNTFTLLESFWMNFFRCAYCSFHKIGIIYLWPVPEQSPLPGRWLPQWPHRQPSGLHPPIPWAPCWVRSKGAGCCVLAPTLLKVAMAGQRKPLWLIRCGENKGKQEVFSLHVLKAKGVYFLFVNKNPVEKGKIIMWR